MGGRGIMTDYACFIYTQKRFETRRSKKRGLKLEAWESLVWRSRVQAGRLAPMGSRARNSASAGVLVIAHCLLAQAKIVEAQAQKVAPRVLQDLGVETAAMLESEASIAVLPACLCDESCTATYSGAIIANDSSCDDGGSGSEYSDCAVGTDCADCGPRGTGCDLEPPPSSGDAHRHLQAAGEGNARKVLPPAMPSPLLPDMPSPPPSADEWADACSLLTSRINLNTLPGSIGCNQLNASHPTISDAHQDCELYYTSVETIPGGVKLCFWDGAICKSSDHFLCLNVPPSPLPSFPYPPPLLPPHSPSPAKLLPSPPARLLDDGLVGGCTDQTSTGYQSLAKYNDGSCPVIYRGCTDPNAPNHRSVANEDDGSCAYVGCMNPVAFNYDPTATQAGTCIVRTVGCMDSAALNYYPLANVNSGCLYPGCTDSARRNYDKTANVDHGLCQPHVPGCTNRAAANYDTIYSLNDGSCIFLGCTDSTADNFDPINDYDDGSCTYVHNKRRLAAELRAHRLQVEGCMVPIASNYNPSAIAGGPCSFYQTGCTNPVATNYNSAIEQDRNPSDCVYAPALVYGCTSQGGTLNYDSNATALNASMCVYVQNGCTNSIATNFAATANTDDGTCLYDYYGCTHESALNHNPLATAQSESVACVYPVEGCMYPTAINYAADVNVACSGCCSFPVPGCMLPTASNYNPTATVHDSSCTLYLPPPMMPSGHPYASAHRYETHSHYAAEGPVVLEANASVLNVQNRVDASRQMFFHRHRPHRHHPHIPHTHTPHTHTPHTHYPPPPAPPSPPPPCVCPIGTYAEYCQGQCEALGIAMNSCQCLECQSCPAGEYRPSCGGSGAVVVQGAVVPASRLWDSGTGPAHSFLTIESGTCYSLANGPVTSADECEHAAQMLALSDTSANTPDGSSMIQFGSTSPSDCYYQPNNIGDRKLWFNFDNDTMPSWGPCTTESQCVCVANFPPPPSLRPSPPDLLPLPPPSPSEPPSEIFFEGSCIPCPYGFFKERAMSWESTCSACAPCTITANGVQHAKLGCSATYATTATTLPLL